MAEQQGSHRRDCEKISVKAASQEIYLGQIFAFIIAMLVIGVAGFLIFKGKITTGLIVLFIDFAAMLGSSYLTRPKNIK